MKKEELRVHNLTRTKHLSSCPVYGSYSKDDEPCCCSEINKDEYIKKLESKIDLMRYFVPKNKEEIIDKKIRF